MVKVLHFVKKIFPILCSGILFIFCSIASFCQTDTIKTYLERSTGFKVYHFTSGGKEYPLTGTNQMYQLVGSKFLFSGKAALKGVLVAFEKKIIKNNNIHQIIAYHLDTQGNMPTGTAIGVGNYFPVDIDTSSSSLKFTWLPFDVMKPVVTQNFGIMVMTLASFSEDDFVSIYTNKQGDGQLMKTSFDMYVGPQNKWVYENLYDFPASTEIGDNADIDLMIVPVIDFNTRIDQNVEFDDIQLISTYPNPVKDNVSIKISGRRSGIIKVSLLDLKGNILKEEQRNSIIPGDQIFDFRMKDYSSGIYFLMVQDEKTKFSGMIIKE